MKVFLKMAGVLAIIGAVCSFLLAAVNDMTLERRENAVKQEKVDALKAVLPEFDNSPMDDVIKLGDKEVYTAKKNKKTIAYAVLSSDFGGYSGEVQLMVGITPDIKIYKAKVVKHNETPGLGSKSEKPKFIDQFMKKAAKDMSVNKDGGNIDAISGATITSRAVCRAAKQALELVEKNKSKLK